MVDSAPLAIDEHVTLQAVGKRENELAAVVPESVLIGTGTERMLKQVLPTGAAAKIVALPVTAIGGFVPFDEPIVL